MARSTSTTSSTSSLLFFLSSLLTSTLGAEYTISNAQDFVTFYNVVSCGSTHSGTTVLLENDLDFAGGYSEQLDIVGINHDNPFNGVFDGQGHIISNLNMSSSSLEYTGIIGFSQGTTIQNVVIDASCSFESSIAFDYSYVGSALGSCFSGNGPCIIESVVNMASVSFKGNATYNLFVGGIAGFATTYGHPNTLKNCVNYGPVTQSGTSGSWTYISGIASAIEGSSTTTASIHNCLNYGTITHSGSSKNLVIGGIAGNSYYTTFGNCVNSGAISTNQESENIGGIVGQIYTYSEITHCFWTSDAGDVSAYGVNKTRVDVTETSLVTLNQATLDELNEYASKNSSWSKWVMLHLNGERISTFEKESLIGIVSALPVTLKEGYSFLWFKDAGCREVFDPKADHPMSLYAGWIPNNYTVTFDLGNGTIVNESFPFNTTIEYPKNMVREGFTFSGWDNRPEFMPAMNIAIKALWIPNNYTVTFDLGNGTVVNESFPFNATIAYPKNMMREGYTFSGWDNRPEFMPAMDITIKAQWVEAIVSRDVEIVFETKDIATKDEEEMKEEIREIIKTYTDEEFVIEKIEIDPETGETRVIIKFSDPETANEFVRVINENKRPDSPIKNARAINELGHSLSSPKWILSLFSLVLLSF